MKALFVLMIFSKLVVASLIGGKELYRWSKSGFCRHDWEIYDTLPYGPKHWYKCKKCSEKRLR